MAIRFYHAADLHLDSPFKGVSELPKKILEKLRNSTFEAYNKIIELALENKPDFILFVGDIYDGEDRSLRAQQRFIQGLEKLASENIPVIISHGNHDHLAGNWTRFTMPENVTVLGAETQCVTLQVSGQAVHIYGFSYPERHVRKSRLNTYPEAENRNDYYIGMLHGSLAGDTTHEVYAPFTREQLLEKKYDYWALGHIHVRQTLHEEPHIVYPGNIQSRHRNEQGVKGFYEVELSKQSTALHFHSTSQVVYEKVSVNCPQLQHANEFLSFVSNVLNEIQDEKGMCIVDFELKNIPVETMELLQSETIEEWLENIRESQEYTEQASFIRSLTFKQENITVPSENSLFGALFETMDNWDDKEWKAVLKDVHQHARMSKFLDPLTDEEKDELLNEAKSIIRQQIAGEL